MKVLLINGSPNEFGCTRKALDEMAKVFHEKGVETEILYFGKKPSQGCIVCGYCRKNNGKCVFNDEVNAISARMDEFDGVVVGSPVYYAGPSSQITAFLDRFFYSNTRKMHGKPGAAIVSCRRGGATAAFDRLNKYFSLASMPIVTSQYWNQVHGSVAEDVEKDEEGMQTMRTLAKNMVWLLKCIEAGKSCGVEFEENEEIIRTSFIR